MEIFVDEGGGSTGRMLRKRLSKVVLIKKKKCNAMTNLIPKAHNEYYCNTMTMFCGGFGVENPITLN